MHRASCQWSGNSASNDSRLSNARQRTDEIQLLCALYIACCIVRATAAATTMHVFRESYGGEYDVKPVTPERDSFVRISVTDADDHTTQQISESRTLSLHSLSET